MMTARYYIETTREEVSKIRKENNRHAYLKRLEKESGCVTVSLNELDLYGENEQEDRIVDPTAFVDKIYIAKETSAEIQKALSMLTDKQRDKVVLDKYKVKNQRSCCHVNQYRPRE